MSYIIDLLMLWIRGSMEYIYLKSYEILTRLYQTNKKKKPVMTKPLSCKE